MVTELQYLLLSQLVYEEMNLVDYKGKTIEHIWNDLVKERPKEGYELRTKDAMFKVMNDPKYFNAIKDMKLVNFEKEVTGFAGAAFEINGEIVFAFRGTEPEKDLYSDLVSEDLFNIGINGALFDERHLTYSQFDSCKKFVAITLGIGIDIIEPQLIGENYELKDEINKAISQSDKNISFTGHSLGGGLAAYMAYYTDRTGKTLARTFNAVGTAQMIPWVDFSNPESGKPYENYDVIDYADEGDIIGSHLGIQIGKTVYLKCKDLTTKQNRETFITYMKGGG